MGAAALPIAPEAGACAADGVDLRGLIDAPPPPDPLAASAPDPLAACGTGALLQPVELALLDIDLGVASPPTAPEAAVFVQPVELSFLADEFSVLETRRFGERHSVSPNSPSGKRRRPSTELYAHTTFKKAASTI